MTHGCKYSDPFCTVTNRIAKQSGPCEDCFRKKRRMSAKHIWVIQNYGSMYAITPAIEEYEVLKETDKSYVVKNRGRKKTIVKQGRNNQEIYLDKKDALARREKIILDYISTAQDRIGRLYADLNGEAEIRTFGEWRNPEKIIL